VPLIRLQKFLAQAGVCSRRKGETYITAGRVRVNGAVVTELGTKVDPATDQVEVDGRPVALDQETVYLILNKPTGYVTTCEQPTDKIVLDLVDVPERIFPVGRLDKDSTGLVLLTNDGRIHHRLLHPSFDHEKEYELTVGRPMDRQALKRMAQGVVLDGTKTRSAKIKRLAAKRFRITLQEGRNRQIRRMVGKVGNYVVRLKRIRMANLKLGDLSEGKWRYLKPAEIKALLKLLD
jgi:23S rRNA pseudouridine2605 synthase/23S rRNA pseudouridine2604 synthase